MSDHDFTYKWGEEVRETILSSWPYLSDYMTKIEFYVYAFDMIQINDENSIKKMVKDLLDANPLMVDKAKKNPKLQGWFAGQLLKENKNLNPPLIAKIIRDIFEEIK